MKLRRAIRKGSSLGWDSIYRYQYQKSHIYTQEVEAGSQGHCPLRSEFEALSQKTLEKV